MKIFALAVLASIFANASVVERAKLEKVVGYLPNRKTLSDSDLKRAVETTVRKIYAPFLAELHKENNEEEWYNKNAVYLCDSAYKNGITSASSLEEKMRLFSFALLINESSFHTASKSFNSAFNELSILMSKGLVYGRYLQAVDSKKSTKEMEERDDQVLVLYCTIALYGKIENETMIMKIAEEFAIVLRHPFPGQFVSCFFYIVEHFKDEKLKHNKHAKLLNSVIKGEPGLGDKYASLFQIKTVDQIVDQVLLEAKVDSSPSAPKSIMEKLTVALKLTETSSYSELMTELVEEVSYYLRLEMGTETKSDIDAKSEITDSDFLKLYFDVFSLQVDDAKICPLIIQVLEKRKVILNDSMLFVSHLLQGKECKDEKGYIQKVIDGKNHSWATFLKLASSKQAEQIPSLVPKTRSGEARLMLMPLELPQDHNSGKLFK